LAVAPVLESAAAAWAPSLNQVAMPLASLAPLTMLSAVGLGLLVTAAAVAVVLTRVTSRERSTFGATWDCGYAAPSRRMQYTSSSFAEGLVGFFSWALRPSVHFDAPAGLFPPPASFHTHVADTVLERAVLPLTHTGARTLRWFRWVQHGNLQLYLVYVLATVLVLILVGR
jgi:hydrogenase-4 component B